MSFAPSTLGASEEPPPPAEPHPALEWAKALALAALWTAGVKAAEKCAEWGIETLKERAKKKRAKMAPPIAPETTSEEKGSA